MACSHTYSAWGFRRRVSSMPRRAPTICLYGHRDQLALVRTAWAPRAHVVKPVSGNRTDLPLWNGGRAEQTREIDEFVPEVLNGPGVMDVDRKRCLLAIWNFDRLRLLQNQ